MGNYLLRRAVFFLISFISFLALLVGCAGHGSFPRPADFPLHATDHRYFDLHWRLDREPGKVEAFGVVQATRQGGIADVTIELRGLDREGRALSRALGTSYGERLFLGEWQPFVVPLRLTGQEDRFELKVWSFRWDTGGKVGAR